VSLSTKLFDKKNKIKQTKKVGKGNIFMKFEVNFFAWFTYSHLKQSPIFGKRLLF
jgi:hypothetical protein